MSNTEINNHRMQTEEDRRSGTSYWFGVAGKVIEDKLNQELSKNNVSYGWLVTPLVVLISFSCEAGLKSLLLKSNKQPKKTHDLFKLFTELDADTQDRIKKNITSTEFEATLKKSSKTFEEWRYLESKAEDQNLSANLLFLKELNTGIHKCLGFPSPLNQS